MKVKIWGSRGSIPSPGRETLIFGGESTCVEVISDSRQMKVLLLMQDPNKKNLEMRF